MQRLQQLIPEAYCDESRDYQLLCRLYDCIVQGIKFDVDGVADIINTQNCRSNLLPLLQTKLGFFTSKSINDRDLRYVLQVFPTLVRNKGSLKAIKGIINTFFKIKNINTSCNIWYVEEAQEIYNTWVKDHTIIIAMKSSLQDVSLLLEVFKYILPVGYSYYFYFYTGMSSGDQKYYFKDKAKLIFTTDNINSQFLSSFADYTKSIESGGLENGYLFSAVDTIEFIPADEVVRNTLVFGIDDRKLYYDPHGAIVSWARVGNDTDEKETARVGTGSSRTFPMYLGAFDSFDNLPDDFEVKEGDLILLKESGNNFSEYIYENNEWSKLKFRGLYPGIEDWESSITEAKINDVIGVSVKNKYEYYLNNEWHICNYKGLVFNSIPEKDAMSGYIADVKKDDCYKVFSDIFTDDDLPDNPSFKANTYYLAKEDDFSKKLNVKDNWIELKYIGYKVDRPEHPSNYDLIMHDDLQYWRCIRDGGDSKEDWEKFDAPLYMINQYVKEKESY